MFSTIGHDPEPPRASTDCQPIVSRTVELLRQGQNERLIMAGDPDLDKATACTPLQNVVVTLARLHSEPGIFLIHQLGPLPVSSARLIIVSGNGHGEAAAAFGTDARGGDSWRESLSSVDRRQWVVGLQDESSLGQLKESLAAAGTARHKT